MNRLARTFAFSAICWFGAGAAQAEKIVVSLSNHRVAITSNFIGEDLVLFGAIEPSGPGEQLHGKYDVVATVTGPQQTYRTRRKARVLGIWVNVDSREFAQVPSYLAVLANRPFAEIANTDNLRRLRIGLNNFQLTQRIGPDLADTVRDDPFRVAFVTLENSYGLYRENAEAVTFLTPTVFRASVGLPSQVPTGTYSVNVKLLTDGQMVAQTDTDLRIIKAGFEQYIADAARDYGVLYGLATALLALLTGWFASVVFKRD